MDTLLLGFVILILLTVSWFTLYYFLQPHVEHPDGKARLTGSCGDTMEILLKFDKGRVIETAYWTNGCAFSLNCICAVAEIAKGKTPDEILEIDSEMVQKSIGGLPPDQMHCAMLSVETLFAALDDYMNLN